MACGCPKRSGIWSDDDLNAPAAPGVGRRRRRLPLAGRRGGMYHRRNRAGRARYEAGGMRQGRKIAIMGAGAVGAEDRENDLEGKSVSVRVGRGGPRLINKKKQNDT